MGLIAHIIWKDIRSERWALLAWVAMYLGQIALGIAVFQHDSGEREFMDDATTINAILVGVQFVTAFALMVRLVQADALAGTRMFWLTRPISNGRLLCAKAGGLLLLFGLLPVLVKLPWWLACGFSISDVGWAAFETLGWQLLLIAPALLIASLTDDFGRALMWGLVTLLVVGAGLLFLHTRNFHSAVALRIGGGLAHTRLFLTGLLFIAGAGLLTVWQFHSRRSARTIALAAVAGVVALTAGRWWPWDCAVLFTRINDPVPTSASSDYPGLQLTLGPAQAIGAEPSGNSKTPKTWILQNAEIQGVPAGWSLGGVRVWPAWTWTAESEPVTMGSCYLGDWSRGELRRILAMPAWAGDAETVRWLDAKYRESLAKEKAMWSTAIFWQAQEPARTDFHALKGRMVVPDSLVARMRAAAPAINAKAEIELGRPRLYFELPLRTGATWHGNSAAYRVGEWGEREATKAKVQMLSATPAIRKAGLWWADEMDRPYRSRDARDRGFVAVNRFANTFEFAGRSGDMARAGRVVIAGVALEWATWNVHTMRVIRNGEWVAQDPQWLEHTSLAMVGSDETVRLLREVKADRYELQASDESRAKGKPGESF